MLVACSKKATDALAGLTNADPLLAGQTVTYKSGDDTVQAYFSKPIGDGPFPAVILIHEWWGLTDWVKGNADKFAQKGYVAIAIDLYRGSVAADADAAHQLMRGLPQDRAIRDLGSIMTYLSEQKFVNPKKIGSIGWCMGGSYSLQAAINLPSLAACVINYGGLVESDSLVRQIHAPILINAGANDKWPSPADVAKFEERAKRLNKTVKTVIYPGVGHAFINSTNTKAYNKEQAEIAWSETWALFENTLKK